MYLSLGASLFVVAPAVGVGTTFIINRTWTQAKRMTSEDYYKRFLWIYGQLNTQFVILQGLAAISLLAIGEADRRLFEIADLNLGIQSGIGE